MPGVDSSRPNTQAPSDSPYFAIYGTFAAFRKLGAFPRNKGHGPTDQQRARRADQRAKIRRLLTTKVDEVLLQAGNPGPEVMMYLPPGWELERIGIENGAEVLGLKVRVSVLQGASSTPKT